jgi:two-component system nitrate/nitrite response regulator NarL
MRFVLCDDHRLLVEALATAIVRAGHTVEAVAWTPADGLSAVERHRPDVLLLDLTFPNGDSLGVAREMVARHPETRTVVLTGSSSVRPLQEALAIGVAGYLRKDERIDQMLATVERCVRGEQILDEVLMRRLDRAVQERERNRAVTTDFTPRERAVANLLREGLNTAEIVARLGISESTVRTHVQAILNKLSVHSRVQAVALLDGPPVCGDEAVS